MFEIIGSISIAILVVIVLSLLYHILPAKDVSEGKPIFVLFPKYQIPITDHSKFAKNLESLGFKKVTDKRYIRGHVWGDFLARWIRLTVRLDEQLQSALLGSPLMVIIFDNGDLWKIATQLKE